MGARLGHLAVTVVLLLAGCDNRLNEPAEPPTERPTAAWTVATSIPEPTPSAPPYADAEGDVRQVAERFVRAVLEYDATTDEAGTFLGRVALITTPAGLDRLRKSARARLDWRALRDREEQVELVITGISVAATGRVAVEAERTTHTSFATVRDFIQLSLELARDDGTLKVAHADGGGL